VRDSWTIIEEVARTLVQEDITHATAVQTVSGFKAAIGVTAVVNGLLILLALSGVLAKRIRRVSLQPTA
jgi:hypothetical protein